LKGTGIDPVHPPFFVLGLQDRSSLKREHVAFMATTDAVLMITANARGTLVSATDISQARWDSVIFTASTFTVPVAISVTSFSSMSADARAGAMPSHPASLVVAMSRASA
jgi:hypothetical protein